VIDKVKSVIGGKRDGRGEKPADPNKLLYWWQPTDQDVPDDLVINAGASPMIIGAQAFVPEDSPRLDVGDRRQGKYYIQQIGTGAMKGVSRVKDLSIERVRQLDKVRRVRLGEEPADWIKAARARSAAGEGPPALEDGRTAMTSFQRAMTNES
jgi:hypothetical protein